MTHFLLAQLDGLNPLNPTGPVGKSTGLVFMDVLAIVATGLVLGAVLLVWARYRARSKKHRPHRQRERTATAPTGIPLNEEGGDDGAGRDDPRHSKRRRRRRDHRPRNPTLGETGGLPPNKSEPTAHPPL